MMSEYVNTVCGEKHIDDLGFISPHEHILFSARDGCMEEELEELRDYRHFGGSTIMEMSTPEICAYDVKEERIAVLKMLSEESGVNIVYGAGFYKEPRLPQIVKDADIDELKEEIERELLEGRGPERIKAGFIGEVGSSNYTVHETAGQVPKRVSGSPRIPAEERCTGNSWLSLKKKAPISVT